MPWRLGLPPRSDTARALDDGSGLLRWSSHVCNIDAITYVRFRTSRLLAAGIIFTTGYCSYTYADGLHVMPIDRLWTPVIPTTAS